MIRPLKRALLQAAKTASLYQFVRNSRWRRNRLAILCYHGVSVDDEHIWDPRCYVSPQILEQRMLLLRRNEYHVLPLGEGIRRLYEGSLPPRSVAVTFDDGSYDFYASAYPILKKYRIPATVYLTTYYCYHPKPVFGMFCYYLMWKGRHTYRGGPLAGLDRTFDLSTEGSRMRAAEAVVRAAAERRLSLPARDALAEELAAQLGVDYAALLSRRVLQLMTPAEVAEVAAAGVDIQLHTHRHRTPLDAALFAREIADNRRCIAEILGSAENTVHFCYPSGICQPEFLPWLRGQRVVSATTCQSGLASARHEPLLLPRIVDHCGLDALEFEGWLSGFTELLPRRTPSPWRLEPDHARIPA